MRAGKAMRGLIWWGWAIAAAGGCSTAQPVVSLRSDDPIGRSRALAGAVRAEDQGAVSDVIGLLESDDPAVRIFAIEALEELTGTTMGYRALASEQEREAGIERWRDALESGELSRNPGHPGDQ